MKKQKAKTLTKTKSKTVTVKVIGKTFTIKPRVTVIGGGEK